MARDLFTDLGGNIKPATAASSMLRAHWVEYDIDFSGQPIKLGNYDELIGGQLYRHFKSEFEALMWIKGYGLQARYLGEGHLHALKRTKGINK